MSFNPQADADMRHMLQAILPTLQPTKDKIDQALTYWDGDYNRLTGTPERDLDPHDFIKMLRECSILLGNLGPKIDDQVRQLGN